MKYWFILILFPLVAQANCPEWVPAAKWIQCSPLDESAQMKWAGGGYVNRDGTLGFQFYCEYDDCHTLGIVVANHTQKQVLQLSKKIHIPIEKNPADFEKMAKLRLSIEFEALTLGEIRSIENQELFSKMSSARTGMASQLSDRTGWSWSSHFKVISNSKMSKTLQALLRPEALRWDRYCRKIRHLYELSAGNEWNPRNESEMRFLEGINWITRSYLECKKTGF